MLSLLIQSCGYGQSSQLLHDLEVLSSDSLQGRKFGSKGYVQAAEYAKSKLEAINGLKPAFGTTFFQEFNHNTKKGINIAGVLAGASQEIIVVSAHLDHLGKRGKDIFNGADDNASGSAALIELARRLAESDLQHTILFTLLDAEEIGSIGGQYLVDNFPLAFDNVVLNVNMDMISHNTKNELYACGTYHYPDLKPILEQVKTPVNLLFGHDEPGPDDWTNSSDHRVFHRQGIPFVYFGVEDHDDYHKPTDTFESITPEFYQDAVDSIEKYILELDQKL